MLITGRIRYNPKYIRPKYGRGLFSSFSRLISSAALRVAQSNAWKKGLNSAIALGKSGSQLASKGLKKAIDKGTKAAKKSLKDGHLNKALQLTVDTSSELALDQLNKGIEASADFVKEKLDKKLPPGAAQNI